MKITVIGMIKDSADIIETFIRANGIYADNFVLINNFSSDNTEKILSKLKEEGYDIELLRDTECSYLQSMKMNILIKDLVKREDTDWIVPLDDDEVLVSDEGNVRDIFESLDKNAGYHVRWRIYVPTEEDDLSDNCVIRRQRFTLADKMVSEKKVIFNKQIAEDEKFLIVQGNHDFVGSGAQKIKSSELRVAHFPVRSEAQILSKVLVGWTNILAMPFRKEGNGIHQKIMYDTYKSTGHLSIEHMWMMCMLYSDEKDVANIEVEHNPIYIDERAFEIKYTGENEVNPLINYMNNTEVLAQKYAELFEKQRR